MGDTYLKEWNIVGSKVHLTYNNGTELLIDKTDFDRAFGCIVSASKEVVLRDYVK